ncbi:response regulator [Microbacterium sp. NPDC016588]
MSSDIRVVVVDDQRLIRESIAEMLALQEGVSVVGSAGDGIECVEVVVAQRPDVVLMDVRMPRLDGVAAAGELRRLAPSVRVLMLTTFDDESYVRGAILAGAVGYIFKDRPIQEIAAAIRATHAGIGQFDVAALARIQSSGQADSGLHVDTVLTEREAQVLRALAAGATNREIAQALHLSEGTVKNHVSRILDRLGLRHRTEAAAYAWDHGLR